MNRYFTILVLTFLWCQLFSQSELNSNSKGYIVTLSGDHLTGRIGNVVEAGRTSFVLFINDFGTPYMIRAELIQGFAFNQDKQMLEYETQFDSYRWMFMKVLVKGEGISLFRSPPSGFLDPSRGAIVANQRNYVPSRFYISKGNRQPIPIKKWGFKRNMRMMLQDRAPDLATQIGEKGFKYRDLEAIIKKYNKEFSLTRYSL